MQEPNEPEQAEETTERLPEAVVRRRALLECLRNAPARGRTKAELAEKLDRISERTVDRYIKELKKLGAEIDAEKRGDPKVLHFKLKKPPVWDTALGVEVHMALRLAGLLLSRSGTQLWDEPLSLVQSLIHDRISVREQGLLDALRKAVHVQGGVEDPVESPDVLPPILAALAEKKVLQVSYRAAGAAQERVFRLAPHSLTHDLFGGGAFLLGWEVDRRVVTQLRLNRIVTAEVLERHGVIPDPERLRKAARYQVGGWVGDREPFEVRARIKGKNWVQSFLEAPPGLPDFESHPVRGNQETEVRFKANHPNGARRWIQQFGEDAVLLADIPE